MNSWRFPVGDQGKIRGSSNGDMEIFKKTPYALFGREIIQNAIDVSIDDNRPVRLVFKEFEIKSSSIPDIDSYKKQVIRCKKFFERIETNADFCDQILSTLDKEKIKILRISDYNTCGLVGMDSEDICNNNFLAITKGTGVSIKKGIAAGSKGVGKNAAINLSQLKMVFYSSLTYQGKKGSLGVCELISGFINDKDVEQDKKGNYIQGSGYYEKSGNINGVIPELISLDNSYKRKNNETGTDIFIVGFDNEEGWEQKVINSALDSYMGAFVTNKLEIEINGNKISKDNLETVVNSDLIFEKNRAEIISQYLILANKRDVKVFEKSNDYGKYKFYLMPVDEKDKKIATHNCTIIRYPLMKIRDCLLGPNIQASAICIIENDKMGEILRDIENAQHNDWEPKRIKDRSFRKEIVAVLNEMFDFFAQCISEYYKLDEDSTLDPYGAGDYLPEFDEENGNIKIKNKNSEDGDAIVSKPKRNKPKSKPGIAESDSDSDEGLQPDIGGIIEDDEGNVTFPEGHNKGEGGDLRDGTGIGKQKDGDDPILKRTSLKVFKYFVVCKNKKEGIFNIKFVALEDKNDCYFNIFLLDDTNGKNDLPLIYAKINGTELNYVEKLGFGPFSVKSKENVIIEIKTQYKKQFGSEVNILC